MQQIIRKYEFDAGHRVMNERMKCFSSHGHRYQVHLMFEFSSLEEIGYAIDFKEIKRIGCQWIDDYWDHGTLLNPHDNKLIATLRDIGSKVWLMSLGGEGQYCNPTAENISKELFMAQEILFASYEGLYIKHITLFETPNCWVECTSDSISQTERVNFYQLHQQEIEDYARQKGVVEYDDRKI